MADAPQHYSVPQIALHWTIAVLVAVQFLFAEPMEDAWRAWRSGTPGSGDGGATVHVTVGLSILALAVIRLAIRLTRGAPAMPANHPAALRFLAAATHWLLYGFLFFMPLSGMAAWFGGVPKAAFTHVIAKNFLLGFVILHVVGAFAELLVLRTHSFQRMLGTEPGR